jgi:hypothetical protein
MQPLRTHHAVVIKCPWFNGPVYGRVEGHSGAQMDGIHAIVVVRTPCGTKIEVGRVWVSSCNDVELCTLKGYEFNSLENHGHAYVTKES